MVILPNQTLNFSSVAFMKNELLLHLDKLHTTKLGMERIKTNLHLDTWDVVDWCKQAICAPHCSITRKGKNWYAEVGDCRITVNAHSYTIITAHKMKV
ncbi:DUF3781 domain-containing protein [Desulfovibrio cuneatus]|uniref:DUF3781 domain-containing protein n=1 Tax=Desulfovibrio cuneatus TaxID=159728 RepID=UPI003F6E3D25